MGEWLALGVFLTPIYAALLALFWIVLRKRRARLAGIRELLVSGTEAAGRISAARKYMARGGAGLSIHYEFDTAAGEHHLGKKNLLTQSIAHPENYVEGAPAAVLYLPSQPAINLVKELYEPALGLAELNVANAVTAIRFIMGLTVFVWILMLLLTILKVKP